MVMTKLRIWGKKKKSPFLTVHCVTVHLHVDHDSLSVQVNVVVVVVVVVVLECVQYLVL